MNPVAFEVFGLEIRWYGIIISMGVLAAMGLIYILAKKKNINYDTIIDAFSASISIPNTLVAPKKTIKSNTS